MVDCMLPVVELIDDSLDVAVVEDHPVLEVVGIVVKLLIDVVPMNVEVVWGVVVV